MEFSAGRGQRIKQQERAERILDVAAELLVRWGYKRVTIEEIARHAAIGTGTMYLHWKTKEAVFECVLAREMVAIWRALLDRIQADPQQVLVHNIMRSVFLITGKRPLARALFTQDSELLGKLAKGESLIQPQQMMDGQAFVVFLRDLGLLRVDSDIAMQAYALGATVTGFTLSNPGQDFDQLSLEAKADALAQTIHLAFEPEELPSPEVLQEKAVPTLTRLLEQTCEYCEQQIRERTMR